MMKIPYFPFRITAAFGSAMFALVMIVQSINILRRAPQSEGGNHVA